MQFGIWEWDGLELSFHKDDFILDMCYSKHCSLKWMHKRRANFQWPPSLYWPFHAWESHCQPSTFPPLVRCQRNEAGTLAHFVGMITELCTKFLMLKERWISVLWKLKQRRNKLLAFSDWRFEKSLLTIQFTWLLSCACSCRLDTDCLYLIPWVG